MQTYNITHEQFINALSLSDLIILQRWRLIGRFALHWTEVFILFANLIHATADWQTVLLNSGNKVVGRYSVSKW